MSVFPPMQRTCQCKFGLVRIRGAVHVRIELVYSRLFAPFVSSGSFTVILCISRATNIDAMRSMISTERRMKDRVQLCPTIDATRSVRCNEGTVASRASPDQAKFRSRGRSCEPRPLSRPCRPSSSRAASSSGCPTGNDGGFRDIARRDQRETVGYRAHRISPIERHVRHARSHRAERRGRERGRRGHAWHGVHASSAGSTGVRHGNVGVLRRVCGRARLPRIGRDDAGSRGGWDARGSGVRQPRHWQDHRLPGNAAKSRRQCGVRRTGLRGGKGALCEAATRPDLREHKGQRQEYIHVSVRNPQASVWRAERPNKGLVERNCTRNPKSV